jgi:hypothetical protein
VPRRATRRIQRIRTTLVPGPWLLRKAVADIDILSRDGCTLDNKGPGLLRGLTVKDTRLRTVARPPAQPRSRSRLPDGEVHACRADTSIRRKASRSPAGSTTAMAEGAFCCCAPSLAACRTVWAPAWSRLITLTVCALADRQTTVANIPTPIPSFVMASCFVSLRFGGAPGSCRCGLVLPGL